MTPNEAGVSNLLEFLEQYSKCTSFQIRSIREQFKELSEGIGESISLINSQLDSTVKEANAVVTHRSGDELKRQMEDMEARFRRAGGKYSKYMESLSRVEDRMSPILLSMVAAMSMSDVLSQRISHIITASKAAHAGLSEILVDFGNRCDESKVSSFKESLIQLNREVFSTEIEKQILEQVFGDEKAS